MNTQTTIQKSVTVAQKVKHHTEGAEESKFFQYAEANRFGIISMILIFVGCLGGVTLSLGGLHNDLTLIGLIVTTMSTLSLLLAVQPMKYIIFSAGAAVAVNIISLISLAL